MPETACVRGMWYCWREGPNDAPPLRSRSEHSCIVVLTTARTWVLFMGSKVFLVANARADYEKKCQGSISPPRRRVLSPVTLIRSELVTNLKWWSTDAPFGTRCSCVSGAFYSLLFCVSGVFQMLNLGVEMVVIASQLFCYRLFTSTIYFFRWPNWTVHYPRGDCNKFSKF